MTARVCFIFILWVRLGREEIFIKVSYVSYFLRSLTKMMCKTSKVSCNFRVCTTNTMSEFLQFHFCPTVSLKNHTNSPWPRKSLYFKPHQPASLLLFGLFVNNSLWSHKMLIDHTAGKVVWCSDWSDVHRHFPWGFKCQSPVQVRLPTAELPSSRIVRLQK